MLQLTRQPPASGWFENNYVQFRDLEFATVPVRRYSSRGTPFTEQVPVGMPRIPQSNLDTVFYLYPSEAAAKAGKDFGGTGFLVAVPSERFPDSVHHTYAVTNWHVACRDGHSVVRLNTKDGGTDVIPFGPEQWEFLPDYDIAVVPMPLRTDVHKSILVPVGACMSKARQERLEISPGDDVYMIGRFVDHDGGVANQPAVRFGHISVMPTPIKQPNGKAADSYCIDVHSRTGYSGSPVFVYRTPGSDLGDFRKDHSEPKILLAGVNFLCLLGVHFAQFPELWELTDKAQLSEAASKESLITEGRYVKGLSGMTCVLPGWTIREVLDMPKLRDLREKVDELWAKKYEEEGYPPEAESASSKSEPSTKEDNPSHEADFNRLVGAAALTPKSDGQT